MKDYFLFAFNSLKRRKLRAWLTMIGIFIGIAAVVGLISLGQGLQQYINDEFEKLGSDKIIVMSRGFGSPGSVTAKSLVLTSKDLKVVGDVRGVKWAIGFLTKNAQMINKEGTNINYVIGMNPDEVKLMSEIQSFEI